MCIITLPARDEEAWSVEGRRTVLRCGKDVRLAQCGQPYTEGGRLRSHDFYSGSCFIRGDNRNFLRCLRGNFKVASPYELSETGNCNYFLPYGSKKIKASVHVQFVPEMCPQYFWYPKMPLLVLGFYMEVLGALRTPAGGIIVCHVCMLCLT